MSFSTTSVSPAPLPPRSVVVIGASASAISFTVATVFAGASSSLTGSGIPIEGGATAWAMASWGTAGRAIDGGTPSSV